MQQDKELRDLLMRYAVEEPAVDFTDAVMQQVEAAENLPGSSLLKHSMVKVLAVIFMVVSVALLVVGMVLRPTAVPVLFAVNISPEHFFQVVYFLIAFWVVMGINQMLTRRGQPV